MLYYIIGLGVLSFLMVQDLMTPYAKSSTSGNNTDYLGNHFVLDFVWNLTKREQFLLSLLCTFSLIVPWSMWIHRQQDELQLSYSHLMIAIISVSGYMLRRWAKITLQRFYTYHISIPDSLITDGPYKILIHPGYSGHLIHLLGVLLLFIPPIKKSKRELRARIFKISFIFVVAAYSALLALLLKRMEDEEKMLHDHFGEKWINYISDRWRLVPFLY